MKVIVLTKEDPDQLELLRLDGLPQQPLPQE